MHLQTTLVQHPADNTRTESPLQCSHLIDPCKANTWCEKFISNIRGIRSQKFICGGIKFTLDFGGYIHRRIQGESI